LNRPYVVGYANKIRILEVQIYCRQSENFYEDINENN